MTKKGVGTILLVYGVVPTSQGNRLVVGSFGNPDNGSWKEEK